MLDYAFSCGIRRVQFRVDAINARSRAAVTKLGAVQEGICRQDMVTWTGRIRDTVVYSILQHEWPDIRTHLEQRLIGFGTGP
jgi:RimJ/RimL family protein N-acetyltransferase